MLKNKVALITGSTSGIGLGMALGLARRRPHVMLNGFGDRSTARWPRCAPSTPAPSTTAPT
jgi:3-hydroxybutyrate dehydrogenase